MSTLRPTGQSIGDTSGVYRTIAVVLAAGRGRRMGGPKWRLDLMGATLLESHCAAYHACGFQVIVVAGEDADEVRRLVGARAEVRTNPDWAKADMASSVAVGLERVGRALVTPVDTAPAHPETLALLCQCDVDAVPTWNGRDGHPVLVHPPHPVARLDHRLRDGIRIPVRDPWCVEDFDTPDAWRRFLASEPGARLER